VLENIMIALADEHKATPMMGRTLGQHALPITFGKKVSTWLGENRRNIERLKFVRSQIAQSTIMKGAVGSYLGLGEQGMEIEREVARELGLNTPFVSDWHPARDVLADYALTLALISKSYGRIGNELFLLQMTDIGETQEILPKTAVGSSTMPHKKNPKAPEKLIQYSRVIPRLAEVILDDVVNIFERDETGATSKVVAEITIQAAAMLEDATYLLGNLRVDTKAMKANLGKTRGLIMAQRITFALADKIGKTTANARMHELALLALSKNISLREAIERSSDISPYFSAEQLDQLFDATTYLGLAVQQVEAVITYCQAQQKGEQ
jgi:adenylosuccinate lyase